MAKEFAGPRLFGSSVQKKRHHVVVSFFYPKWTESFVDLLTR